MASTIIRTNVLESRSTRAALYIQHPRRKTKFMFIPRSEIISISPVAGSAMKRDIEIPDWLAEDRGLL